MTKATACTQPLDA
ncbi:Protein of unknown function [Propionibacterium freudenreichii]|nr:Protein of unknown function [Propionibacterium freudenreichii subsp. freudenreichii]CEG92559.1 Protein of unknown function [Propionibacterium freudenreichii]CEG95242.1 Protein of unknown function [Propionibacterium freudenreichii]CEG98526.1 Protein of unknown function [Propionibacterium freudenreichii]CEH07332.1 Protein of unknown function [Propionibacterium freudenreichii]